ncbi:MAG: hypothetical protein H6818_05440 [Phycisphaerales bacterium]|nr:hypothetical protein [Phycisphaerales bacterium]
MQTDAIIDSSTGPEMQSVSPPSPLGMASIVVGVGAGIVGLVLLGFFYFQEADRPGSGINNASNLVIMEFAAIAFAGLFLLGMGLGITPLIRHQQKDAAPILGILINAFGIASLVGLAVVDLLFY